MTGTIAGTLTGPWREPGQRVLAVVGVGEDAERLYTLLVRRGRASVAELARATGRPPGQVAASLAELDELGLVNEAGAGRWRAASPEIAVEALVLRREEQLAAARRAAARLQEQFRTVLADGQMAEVVRGTEEVRRRLAHTAATASRELWVLDRPPLHVADGVLAAIGTPPPPVLRVLYDADGFAGSGRWRRTPGAESARLFPDLPFSLVVGDGLGVVPMLDGSPQALVVSPSPLLEVLRLVADTLWRAGMSVPERAACTSGPSEEDRQLLTLLSAGLSDRAIARELNLSVRTVERRMRRLLESLGARTRFQAGVQAAARGWI